MHSWMLHFFWAMRSLKGLPGSVLKHVYNSMKSKLVSDYLVLKYWTHLRWENCKAGEYKVGATFYQLASLKHLPLGISVEQNCVYVAFLNTRFDLQLTWTTNLSNVVSKCVCSEFRKGYVMLLKIPKYHLAA